MRIVRRVVINALVLAAVVLAGILTGFIRIDNYPDLGTYGVSVGTDTVYASAELVHGHPELSWERAR
jgi:hypothetical protein